MTNIPMRIEFLPTDVLLESSFWDYGFPVAVLLFAICIAYFGRKHKHTVGSGLVLGTFAIFAIVVTGVLDITMDTKDYETNNENLTSNIQKIYDVDSINLSGSVDVGDTIQVTKSGRVYEVIVSWEPDTYAPTLSPKGTTFDDVQSLRKFSSNP